MKGTWKARQLAVSSAQTFTSQATARDAAALSIREYSSQLVTLRSREGHGCFSTASLAAMKEQLETISIDAAVAVAEAVLSGSVSPSTGCSQIARICRALNDTKELSLFELLAHEQSGHEHIGITAASLEPEIMQACKELVASQLTRRSTRRPIKPAAR